MASSTKDLILNYLSDLSENFDFTQVQHFTASSISDEMHISRSLASQYLNELVKEKSVMKINSRPVYFLHRQKMEELYQTTFQDDDFYDLEEVKQYVMNHSQGVGDYSHIIGSDKSLTGVIKQLRESIEYPPAGLPVVVYGEKGAGKRTLCTTVYENAARKGIIGENTKLVKLEFSPHNQEELLQSVFGQKNKPGLIETNHQIVFIFCGAQHMSEAFQTQLCQLMEADKNHMSMNHKNKIIRYMFVSDLHPSLFMSERLLKNIPVIVKVPSLTDKSNEEKEELIIYFVQQEGKKMNKTMKISNVVLRALVNGDYDNNMIGLQSTIRIMCASALRESAGKNEAIIHTYHLPEHLLQTMPIMINEDVIYINTTTYKKSEQIEFILDYFNRILKPFVKTQSFLESVNESKHNFDLLSDYLSYKQRIPPERIKGTEISLSNMMDIVLKKRYINLPSGFCTTLAKLIYINDLYSSSIQKWQQDNRNLIDDVLSQMKEHLFNESLIVEDIIRLMSTNLEIHATDFLSVIMMVYLQHYNSELTNRKIFGIIVCHGYSTATSIADAVNSLLETYVFDAVDMPLDITVDEIKEILMEKLNRMNTNADVIVMVDMGSLEQLGKSLSSAINCNVGVINNVSTRLALNVANCILNEKDMKTTLQKVSEDSLAHYTIIDRKKNDTILFTSESGIHMAQRMRELFENSFPLQVPVDLEVCDYNQLLASGSNHEIFTSSNVLFMTGTANPQIEGQIFIALEEIISGNNIDIIMKRLSKYLKPDELNQLLDDLRKNFTLQNVVGYLTILNPKVLLDNVSQAVEELQDHLEKRFGGKTLIGIYIHVCCLIERLVTKSAITEFDHLEDFEKHNQSFIQDVHDSFQTLSKRYNMTFPTSEIAYLYEFIAADEKRFEDGELLSKLEKK